MNNLHAPITKGASIPKVKIPKFVAEGIEFNNSNLRGSHVTYQLSLLSNDVNISNWLIQPENAITLIKALTYGYEIEIEYLNWDEVYEGMKEGKIYLRYSNSEMKLDYYKIENNSLMFSDEVNNKLWRSSDAKFNDLLASKFVLFEEEQRPNQVKLEQMQMPIGN